MSTAAGDITLGADRESKLRMFAAGPALLRELLEQIPEPLRKTARKPGKWTIHEHAAHLTVVDAVMMPRLEAFRTEASPQIVPYLPSDKDEAELPLIEMNLAERLEVFERSRAALLEAFRALAPADWAKRADHPEFHIYTPEVMLRHLLMHDHLHMYRIEELWITRDEFLH